MPFAVPGSSSEKTMRMRQSDRLRRRPAKMRGSAEGSSRNHRRSTAVSRSTAATSSRSGSVSRAPSAVLISTGQTALNTIDASCIGVPKSNTTTNTGTSAGGGTARANWSTGSHRA
jgi:hypothetical protein